MSSWLQNNLRPAFKLIGTVLAAIGAIILISAIGKLIIWQAQPLSYYEESCSQSKFYAPDIYAREIMPAPMTETAQSATQTPEELQTCISNRQTADRWNERSRRFDAMIDGLALLIVGGVLVLLNRKKD